MLRKVKLLALVAMFFVALSTSAQVTTSALSGVVTDENQQAMIGATITALHPPSGSINVAEKIGQKNQTKDNSADVNDRMSGELLKWGLSIISVSVVFIIAVRRKMNIKIKFSSTDFYLEIGSKEKGDN
jgi:hypothetical protein